MDQIANGEMSKESVVGDSRELLHKTTTEIDQKQEDLAKVVWAGMDEDKFLGPCKVCEREGRAHEDGEPNRLRIIDLKGGKRMYGCEGWNRDDPEAADSCRVSGPLPGRGYDLWRLEERCSICDETPRLTGKGFRGRPWKLCLNNDCPSMIEMQKQRAERQAAREAREAAKAAKEDSGKKSGKKAAKSSKAKAADKEAAPNGADGNGSGAKPK